MSPTNFSLKLLISDDLTSDVTQGVTQAFTVFWCFVCNKFALKIKDISSDFKEANSKCVTKIGDFP